MIPDHLIINSIADLFAEAYEGPQNDSHAWFTDNEDGSGVLGMLSHISATEASNSFADSGSPGSTIAAHTEHLRWSLALSNALARGETPNANWEESWSVLIVEAQEWDRLREDLRGEYQSLLQNIQARSDLPEYLITPGIAIVAHSAYHVGAIRQMIRRLKRA